MGKNGFSHYTRHLRKYQNRPLKHVVRIVIDVTDTAPWPFDDPQDPDERAWTQLHFCYLNELPSVGDILRFTNGSGERQKVQVLSRSWELYDDGNGYHDHVQVFVWVAKLEVGR